MLQVLDRLTSVASHPSIEPERHFQFFTSYGHVLMMIATDSEIRHRDIADRIGMTERTVQEIVQDLADTGYVTVAKSGRRNCYRLREQAPIHEPEFAHKTVGDFADFIVSPE